MAEFPDAEADQLTAAEGKVVLGVLKHLSEDIQADFDAIATELGYKSAEVAKARWRQVRNKKFPSSARASDVATGRVEKTSPTKKTPVKAKKAGDGGQEAATPTPKKRGKKSKVETKEQDDDATVKVETQDVEDTTVPADVDEKAQGEDVGSEDVGVD